MNDSHVNEADRAQLRARVQELLKSRNLSQRKVEEELNVATGVLSKIWSGKMQLSLTILMALGRILRTDPFELIAGTGFEYLAQQGLEHSPVIEQLRKETDELRERLAARTAELDAERATSQHLLSQVAKATEERSHNLERMQEAEALLTRAQVEKATAIDELSRARLLIASLQESEARDRALKAGLDASLQAQRQQTDQWRKKATELESAFQTTDKQLQDALAHKWTRFKQANRDGAARLELEARNKALTQEKGSSVSAGAMIGGTALAFLVGLAVAEAAGKK